MITGAVLLLLSAIAMFLRCLLRTSEEGVTLPHRILPTVAMVVLLRLLLHSMIAMIEDLMSDTPLTLLPLVVEPELLRGFAMTTTEPHRLGTSQITVVVRPHLLLRVTRTNTLEEAPRTWQPRDIGAAPKVPLLVRQAVRMNKATPLGTEEAFLAMAILVPLGLGIILLLLRAMGEMALPILATTDGLNALCQVLR